MKNIRLRIHRPLVLIGILMLLPACTYAQAANNDPTTIAQLNALISQLTQQLQRTTASQSQSGYNISYASNDTDLSGCGAYASLKKGDTDATTNGAVTRLQILLGVDTVTGYYGQKTLARFQAMCGRLGNSQPTSMPGMSKYVDNDLGFSFWYPGTMSVRPMVSTRTADQYYGNGTTILKTLAAPAFSIDEVYSPSGKILGDMQNDPTPLGSYFYFYYNEDTGNWMRYYQVATSTKGRTVSADLSTSTMGGLHIFNGYTNGGVEHIVPLNAHYFLVLFANCNDNSQRPCGNPSDTSSSIHQFLTAEQTISSTNPSVNAPISTGGQRAAIQAEALAYGVSQVPVTTGDTQTYSDRLHDFTIMYPTNMSADTSGQAEQSYAANIRNGTVSISIGPVSRGFIASDRTLNNKLIVASGTIVVGVSTDPTDVSSCVNAPRGDMGTATDVRTISINGTSFLRYMLATTTGAVATTTTSITDTVYTTLHKGACYSLDERVQNVIFAYPNASDSAANILVIQQVRSVLDTILLSFTFPHS